MRTIASYRHFDRQLFYDADGNGAGAAQLIATLQDRHAGRDRHPGRQWNGAAANQTINAPATIRWWEARQRHINARTATHINGLANDSDPAHGRIQ